MGKFHRQKTLACQTPWDLKDLDTIEGLSMHDCMCMHAHTHTHYVGQTITDRLNEYTDNEIQ